MLVKAYKSLNVSNVAIADFDVLRVRSEFAQILEAFGLNFESISSDYNSAVSALNDLPTIKPLTQFVERCTQLTQRMHEFGEITSSTKGEFIRLLSQSAKWSDAKKYGIAKLSGGVHTACKTMLDDCQMNGFFVVREGELESFWREGSASKSD